LDGQQYLKKKGLIGSAIEPNPIDILVLLTQTSEYLQRRSPKSLRIEIEALNEVPKINIEPVLIGWVIENLVRNAIDSMDGKGVVNISLGVLESSIYIDISDSGKGVNSNDRRAIFKPGYTTKSRGWGLGLSLAKRIIETSHGGKLYLLNSQLDKGSVFRIELNSI